MGKYEPNYDDEQVFFVSKQNMSKNKNLKSFHRHSHFEILIAQSQDNNKSYFVTEEGKYIFTSKSIIFARPNLKHRTERNTKNTTRLLVCFRRSFIEPIADFMDVDIDLLFSKCVLNYTDEKMAEIINIVNKMTEVFRGDSDFGNNKELRLLLATFLHKVTRYDVEADIITDEEDIISEICNYLKYNYKQDVTLEQLSEHFSINKYELCRKMKSKYGCTVNGIITEARINKAKELLENTTVSVVDISDMVGYSSASYFSRKFKAYTGCAPTEYRNGVRK